MTIFQLSLYSKLDKKTTYELFLNELENSFWKNNISLALINGGEIKRKEEILGSIKRIEENNSIVINWKTLSIEEQTQATITIRFEDHNSGTLVLFEPTALVKELERNEKDQLAWCVEKIITPVFESLDPEKMGDWITDRSTRRPTGPDAKQFYNDPLYHWPNFYFLLNQIKLTKEDYILEIGCGGGILLREFLKSGCRAIGIDHSPEMVKLARENNLDAIKNGLLEIHYSSAEFLPFKDPLFSHVIMTGVFQFIENPEKLLKDIYKILLPKGSIHIFGGSKEMKGSFAAPEPFASRLKFYEAGELKNLTKNAGFLDVQVLQPDLTEYAKKAGVQNEYLEMFGSKFSFYVEAKKSN